MNLDNLNRYEYHCPTHGAYDTIFENSECLKCEAFRETMEEWESNIRGLSELESDIRRMAGRIENEAAHNALSLAGRIVSGVRAGIESAMAAVGEQEQTERIAS